MVGREEHRLEGEAAGRRRFLPGDAGQPRLRHLLLRLRHSTRKNPGKMEDLRRHLLCLDRANGKTLWAKEFKPLLPEHKYAGEGRITATRPARRIIDGERLYVFFGKSGVYLLRSRRQGDLARLVGKNTNGWGSGTSPILYKDS